MKNASGNVIIEIKKIRMEGLNVYITHGNSRSGGLKAINNKFRKDAVDFVLKLRTDREMSEAIKQVFENSDNYVKIKNSQRVLAR